MKPWIKLAIVCCVASLAAIPGLGQALTAPPAKGVAVGEIGGIGLACGHVVTLTGAGAALIQTKAFGPKFSATLTYPECLSTSGPVHISLTWFGLAGQITCSGDGGYIHSTPEVGTGDKTTAYVFCTSSSVSYAGTVSVSEPVVGIGLPVEIVTLS